MRARGIILLTLAAALVLPSTSPAVAASAPTNAVSMPATTVTSGVEHYVTSVYNDLLYRDPDPTGLATWTSLLSSGTPRGKVADAITSSDEFRSQLISGAYGYYLGRTPDEAGLQFWLQKFREGWTLEQLDAGFLASEEFYNLYGGNAANWVVSLYEAVLLREPSDSEVEFWVNELQTGSLSMSGVSLGFLLSTEYLTTTVNAYYQSLLGRDIDPSGRATWVGLIQGGARDEQIVAGILASDEYWGIATAS